MNTPGPWIVDQDNDLQILAADGLCAIACVTEDNLDDSGLLQARHDAHLIAAAPELADALAAIYAEIKGSPEWISRNSKKPLLSNAYAALHKAGKGV